MRVQVIMNPAADQGRSARYQGSIRAALQAHAGWDVALTASAGHAVTLARQAAENDYDIVVAAGGDGTVHEVVNGLHQAQNPHTKLGVIPTGSGNDFAFANGIAEDVDTAVDRLWSGKVKRIDLARIEDDRGQVKVFDNNFGLGFDAVVVIKAKQGVRVHGFLMYLYAVLHTLLFYNERPVVTVSFDDESIAQKVLFLAVGVGPRGGGGFLLVPDAKVDDNLIDSCTVDDINRLQMLWMLPKTFSGAHVHAPYVSLRQNRRISIQATGALPIHLDGEVFAYPEDNVRQVTIDSLPGALQVVV